MRKYNQEIQDRFSRIHEAIGDYNAYFLQQVAKEMESRIDYGDLVKDVRDSRTASTRAKIKQQVANKRARTIAKTQLLFSEIRHILDDWVIEPVPDTIENVMRMTSEGLELSLPELRVLAKKTEGVYFAQKYLAKIAEQKYFTDFHFSDFDTLAKMLKGAESDCVKAISSFAGTIDTTGKKFTGAWLTDEQDSFWQMYATDFLSAENSTLKSIEQLLENVTDANKVLFADDYEKLDRAFADTDDKVHTMVGLIIDGVDENILLTYNTELYLQARQKIAIDAEEKARETRAKLRQMIDDNSKAQTTAAKMNAEKHRAESKATNNNIIAHA